MRAQPPGPDARHGGEDAVGPGLVAGRGDDAPVAGAADDDRLAPQLGAPQQLDGHEERVHVDVEDRAGRTVGALDRSAGSAAGTRRVTVRSPPVTTARAGSSPSSTVAERAGAVVPALGQPGGRAARCTHGWQPARWSPQASGSTKRGVDDDAVGVVDAQSPSKSTARWASTRRCQPSPGASTSTSYTGPSQPGHDEAGLLLDLAGEPVEHGLALVDDAAGRAPVVVAVAAAVAHEQQAAVSEDQAAAHQPLSHAAQCGTVGAVDEPSPPPPPADLHRNARAVADAAAPLGLDVEVREFPDGTRTAEDAARPSASTSGQIVKSLVFAVDGDVVVALVSGPNRLDEGRLAAAAGRPAPAGRPGRRRRVRAATGYPIGGRAAVRPRREPSPPSSTRTCSATTRCGPRRARPATCSPCAPTTSSGSRGGVVSDAARG